MHGTWVMLRLMGSVLDRARLNLLFARFGNVISMRDVLASGLPVGTVYRAESRREIIRLGKASFAPAEVWDGADAWSRFRMASVAFGLVAAGHIFLTGPSAQAVLGLPTLSEPPAVPVGIRVAPTSSGTNMTEHSRVRTGVLPPAHQWIRGRVRVVSTCYAAVDIARHSTAEEALAVVDHVLHSGVSKEQFTRLLADLHHYPGIEQAAWAVSSGDDRAESVLESLGRLAFLEAGRPPPLSNVWFSDGITTYRVDHYLPDSGVVLEGDGGLKVNNRPDAHDIVRRQVSRESWLRAHGCAVERYDYAMAINRRSQIVALADRAVRSQQGRPLPTCWSMERPEQVRVG